jgi:hypothetical protein
MAPVALVAAVAMDTVAAVAAAPEAVEVAVAMVAALAVALTAMVVMHHQDPVVVVVELGPEVLLFITVDTVDRGEYRSVTSQPHTHFMPQTV